MDKLSGLTSEEAKKRQKSKGFNELDVSDERSILKIVLEVIREPMFMLLLFAGAIYMGMGDLHDALILLGFVWIIIGVSVFQEWRTEKVLESLRELSAPRAVVIRDGEQKRIAGREVVCGDLVVVSEGDRIPADGILLIAHDLACDESMLSGESESIPKTLGARLYAGTLSVGGQGVMHVDAIGSATELGKIGKSLGSIDIERSPLQTEMIALTKRLAWIAAGLCIAMALVYVMVREEWLSAILAGITLAMGIIPQEFPVIMIIFMAFGARRIARYGVLTRRIGAIGTLGETTVLCVDKTGTLTRNDMAVSTLCVGGDFYEVLPQEELPETVHELIEYAILASETDPYDPMEKAFYRLAKEHRVHTEHLHPDWELAHEYELSSELMAMSHLWAVPKEAKNPVATKGSPEAIIDLCHMEEENANAVMEQSVRMADRGLRVIGVAKAIHSGGEWPSIQHDFSFEFLGLIGLADPIRPEVPQAVRQCHRAGIRMLMITGDHPRTARSIAQEAGIESPRILSGYELDAMDEAELQSKISAVNVFARVTPRQKLRIVESLKASGEIVAMTGDGVNDAPALKAAHIGIAMGKRGTDVAREAAALVLLEDNFESIVETIAQGRRIYANLRKALVYTISIHIPIIALSFFPLLLGLPLVLAPIHIMFIELVIDPACSIVFEAQNAGENVMNMPPRPRHERLVGSGEVGFAFIQGMVASVAVIALYYASLYAGIESGEAKAMAFVTLISANTVLLFNSRTTSSQGLAGTLRIGAVGGWVMALTMAGLAAVSLIPPLASWFWFDPPSIKHWMIALGAGMGMFVLFEGIKHFYPRDMRGR